MASERLCGAVDPPCAAMVRPCPTHGEDVAAFSESASPPVLELLHHTLRRTEPFAATIDHDMDMRCAHVESPLGPAADSHMLSHDRLNDLPHRVVQHHRLVHRPGERSVGRE